MSDEKHPSISREPNSASGESFLDDLAYAPSIDAPVTPRTHLEGAPQPRGDPEAGTRIAERFEIIEEMGRGGFGAVFLARDLELGRHVAVKVMGLGGARVLSDAAHTLFEREAKATARLNHPNIVTVYDWGTYSGLPYLVLERLKGEPLSARLERGPLGVVDAVMTGIQIARGLAHAHEAGVLHLDLKPHNVFVGEDGLVKILDLGLAQIDASQESLRSALGQSPSVVHAALGESPVTGGTPAYMAPEQWRGEPLDERTDLWAVGVLLFEALTGKLPFRVTRAGSTATTGDPAPRISDHAPAVPADLAGVVARCLEKQRGDRVASAVELLDALHAVELALAGPAADTDQPYRYLEPFTESDAAWFFGRDREARRLMGMLENRPLVALVGPSGAGKSSLVQAGLIPRLRRGERPWTVITLRPGAKPLRLLESRLSELDGEVTDLAERPGLAGQVLRAHARDTGQRVLLYVDQFEELFTQVADPEARRSFAAALLSAADDPQAPVRVVLSVRGDFLGELGEHVELRDQVSANNLILSPPDADALAEALVGPARRLGYDFDDGLAAQMVRALQQEAAPLPLLQLAASRLWEKRDSERRLLTHKVLHALGGVAGVLAAHAEEVLQQIPGEHEQWAAREIFLRLVTAEGTRKPMDRASLLAIFPDAGEASRILEHLLRGRLLTSSKRDGKAWIELAHEALVERWDRLSSWLNEDREQRRFHERVTQAAEIWDERDRPANLLWTKKAQAEAAQWRLGFRGAFSGLERDFLDAAEARERRRRRVRRAVIAAAFVAAIAGTLGTIFWMRAYQAAAHAARRVAILKTAVEAQSPLTGALLLLELAKEGEPPGGATAASQVASKVYPAAVLRGHQGYSLGRFSPDGKRVVTWGFDGSLRIWNADGTGDPVVYRKAGATMNSLASFSPDGTRILLPNPDGRVHIFPADGGGKPIVLRGHGKGYVLGFFSPSGARVLTSSTWDGTARIWRADGTGKPIILQHPTRVSVAWGFSPDGSKVVTTSSDGSARIWRADGTGKPIVFRGHHRGRTYARFSPDGSRVLTWSFDGTAKVWRIPQGRSKGGKPPDGTGGPVVLRGHTGKIRFASFSPDGARVVTAGEDKTARIWRADGTGKPIVLRGHTGKVRVAAFSPDGSRVSTASEDGTARIWNSDGSGRPLVLVGSGGAISMWMAEFSPDGTRVVTGSSPGPVWIWRVDGSGEPVVLRGHREKVSAAAFSPDGRLVATGSFDRTTRIWRADGSGRPLVVSGEGYYVAGVAFSPDGRVLASGAQGGALRVLRADGGGTPLLLRGSKAIIDAGLTFSADGRRLLAGSADGARLWWLDGSREPIVFRGHKKRVHSARFSPDESRVVTASRDRTVRVFSADGSGKPIVLRGHQSGVWGAVYSPDGTRILSASRDKTARIWPADGKGEPIVLRGHEGWLLEAVYSPDGSRILSVSADHTARIWRSDGAGEPIVLRGHESLVSGGEFSPDGSLVVTASQDGTARVWRIPPSRSKGGKPPDGTGDSLVLRGHGGAVEKARFSPDGTRVLTAGGDGTARIWRITWKDLIAYLRASTTACLTTEQRVTYLIEPRAEARTAYEACERSHGRTPGRQPVPTKPPKGGL